MGQGGVISVSVLMYMYVHGWASETACGYAMLRWSVPVPLGTTHLDRYEIAERRSYSSEVMPTYLGSPSVHWHRYAHLLF